MKGFKFSDPVIPHFRAIKDGHFLQNESDPLPDFYAFCVSCCCIGVMYADIAAHRAMCSLFLRLTMNDVLSPPVVEHRNKESVSDLSALL